MKRNLLILYLLGTAYIGLAGFPDPARSQPSTAVDLSGNWSADNATDEGMDAPDEPLPGNWAGIPLNASGRALALSYDSAQLAEPYLGLQCGYPPVYMMLGPFGLRISNLTENNNGTTVAWRIGGWVDRGPITIWMDGRAEPSAYAPHPRNGFATGEWVNGMLIAHVSHMPAGIAKRNGAPLSDRATMTLWFSRHGETLTVLARIVDPVYLSQPFLLTRVFLHYVSAPQSAVGEPCVMAYEGVAPDAAPFYLPGQNPLRNVVPETYGIPFSAELAGAASMYPAFRKVLRNEYRRPASCQNELKYQTFPDRACGGPGKYPLRGPGGTTD